MMFSRQLLSFYESQIYQWQKRKYFENSGHCLSEIGHLGFSGYLKLIFPITKFFESYFSKNFDRLDSVCPELKSPHKRNL